MKQHVGLGDRLFADCLARCNGCDYIKLRDELGIKFLSVYEHNGVAVYEMDADPIKGQGVLTEYKGKPVRFRVWFMGIGHSDECQRIGES